jgi:hypothetical protein
MADPQINATRAKNRPDVVIDSFDLATRSEHFAQTPLSQRA